MTHDEKVLLVISGVGLAALVLWKTTAGMREPALSYETGGTPIQAAGYSQIPDPSNLDSGPEYLIYNSPWAFNPDVGNPVPSATIGQIGQVESNPPNFINSATDCGCF